MDGIIGAMSDEIGMVEDYLRAQNLEQLGRVEEALELYEDVVARGFDSMGPYDRLIHLYGHRAAHGDVVRVAESALANVRTYEDKRKWYVTMRASALEAAADLPKPVPRRGED